MKSIGFGSTECHHQYNEIVRQTSSVGFTYTMNKHWCGFKYECNKRSVMTKQGFCDFVKYERKCPNVMERV